MIDLHVCIKKISKGEILDEYEVKFICEKVTELFAAEANIQELSSPITIVGDIHGQFEDLLELFAIGGKVPDTNYLFLGDYVDRGEGSVECISLLVCYKLLYGKRITLLRGNHESKKITKVYGFYTECVLKYGNANVWNHFTTMFDYIPLGALIDKKIFCIHGGLSRYITTIDQIRVLNRFKDIPDEGPLTDLLWSDPDPDIVSPKGYKNNNWNRGVGCRFNGEAVKTFLQNNDVDHIVRTHQLCMEGYQLLFDNTLSTIWSAPNYCYRCGNLGCILEIDDSKNIKK
eukprot:gene2713-3909_t